MSTSGEEEEAAAAGTLALKGLEASELVWWSASSFSGVDLPNLVARGDKVRIERERASAELVDGLRAMGLTVAESEGENSGLSVVLKDQNGALHGGVDPRREGVIERVVFEQ